MVLESSVQFDKANYGGFFFFFRTDGGKMGSGRFRMLTIFCCIEPAVFGAHFVSILRRGNRAHFVLFASILCRGSGAHFAPLRFSCGDAKLTSVRFESVAHFATLWIFGDGCRGVHFTLLDFSCLSSSSWMVQKWGAQDLAGLIFSPHALNFVLSCFECTFTSRYGFDGEWQNNAPLIPDIYIYWSYNWMLDDRL